uniref:Uncharacterized protein n=1 Tax=Moniliophthora roreri TaxID=221103 RepID=A0A0W0EYA0_MONRR
MSLARSEQPKDPVVVLRSRHTGGISMSLSRYQRKWFLTYSRGYGMAYGQRIFCALNTPDMRAPESHARRYFWLNPGIANATYNPDDPDYASQKFVSPVHILLDSETPVARLTGRTRAEISQSLPVGSKPKQIMCFEIEVTIPEEGLLRQCYYCLHWESEWADDERMEPCSDDVFWCRKCKAQGWAASSISGISKKLKNGWSWLVIPFVYLRQAAVPIG